MAIKLSGGKAAAAKSASKPGRDAVKPLPVIGELPVARQYLVLGTLLLLLVAVAGILVVLDYREDTYGASYVSTAADMRMLTQRIPKATQGGLSGNAQAFRQLQESRDQFVAALTLLIQGGEIEGRRIPPSPDAVQPLLDTLSREWEKTEHNLTLILPQQKNLAGLGAAARSLNNNNPALLDLTEKVQALKAQAGAPPRELAAAGQLVTLTQRMARSAATLLGSEEAEPESAAQMTRDAEAFGTVLASLRRAGDTPGVLSPRETEIQARLSELERVYRDYQGAASAILTNLAPLAAAKNAAQRVVDDSETLLAATGRGLRAATGGALEELHRPCRAGAAGRRCDLGDGAGLRQ